jgi:hypothetical protein
MAVACTLLLKTVGGDFTDASCRAAFAVPAERLDSRLPAVTWRVYRGLSTPDVYAYGTSGDTVDDLTLQLPGLRSALQTHGSSDDATLDCLVLKASFPGASQSLDAQCHYVVETDSSPGWEDELFRWYDVEHMPRLAAVQGCIRAQRFVNAGRGPRSYACYDLATSETVTTEPWLAVRRTPWSDRVRAQFRNTRRTMFRPLGTTPGD